MSRSLLFLLLACYFFTPILSTAQQLAPSIQWQKCLGGSSDDKANVIIHTVDNGFLLAGYSNSNDGDVTGHHGSTDSSDAWIVKLSSSGTIEWQRSLGGSGVDVFNSVIPTSDGNYLCFGSSTSSDGDVTGYHGGGASDIWVVMLNHSGSVIWSKCYGGTRLETPGNIRENIDGSFYMIGTTLSIDGDVSGNHGGYGDIWVVKLNKTGTILWEKCFGGSNTDQGFDITEATDGNGFLIAVDVLSSNGDLPLGNSGPGHGFIVKADSTKTLYWTSHIYSGDQADPIQIVPAGNNNYYINGNVLGCSPMLDNFATGQYKLNDAGSSASSTQLAKYTYCGGPFGPYIKGYHANGASALASVDGINYLLACNSDDSVNIHPGFHGGIWDGFISSIGPSGASWNKFIGGSAEDQLNSVVPMEGTEFVVSGYTNSNDGDVTGNHGGFDFWIVKLGNINNIHGSVYLDYNANGIKDNGEPFADNISIQSAKTGFQIGSLTTMNGLFSNYVDTGTYTTKVLSSLLYYTPVPASYSSSFSNYNNSDSLSFALQPLSGKRDYSAQLYSSSFFRPGNEADYTVWYNNEGTDTLNNKTVRLIKDSRLQFLSAVPSPSSISGDTLNWTITQLSPRMQGQLYIRMNIAAPPVVNSGDTLTSTVMIDTTADLNPGNNSSVFRSPVTGSFDPNGITESNGGSISQDYAGLGKYLLYTVFFQNTGTDTAFNITVRDTLSAKLDPTSLEMVGSSNPYQLSIRNGNQLIWAFTNILLPDSNRNEQASHGYLSYRVKLKQPLSPGDSIHNSAGIYFDYNLPVQTNLQITNIVERSVPPVLPFPPAPVISGLASSYCTGMNTQTVKITNIPPAADSVTVSAFLDNTPVVVEADNSFSFIPSILSTGQHSMMVVFSNSAGADTTKQSFTVVTASVPVVKLISNLTNVTNSSGVILISAVNVAGGGNDPSFTFARDSNFTDLFRTESTLNTLTLAASTLRTGSNTIYVRMRSNNNDCSTGLTGKDSLIITRNLTTGLTDMDYPDQPINANPNPFYNHLTVTGLQTIKNYTLQLLSSGGQELLRQEVTGKSSIILNTPVFSPGIYLLMIYDETKSRVIGTVRLSVL